jgi:peptide/nickel transport system substrate-binding protein|tara:strand:- start:1973 stop:3535 length:1563 start_codon:yes stop_codon:yes gene_type:complete
MTIHRNGFQTPLLTRRGALGVLGGGVLAAGTLGASFAHAQTPKRGGTLRIGEAEGGTSDSLDPTTYFTYNMYTVGFTLGNTLVELDANKQPIPELADSWEGSKDAKRWVFKMRKGVEFHNGKTVTAADAVWSLNRHIAADSKSAAKGFLAGVSSIRADGDNVIIEHETGDADIPIIMGDYHLLIVPEGHDDWNNFVGSGAYVLDRFEPGVRFSATRNPNYWKPDRGWVDSVEMLFILDPTARASALMTGEVDVIDRTDNMIVDRIKALNKFQIIESIGTAFHESVMDTRAAPFDNADVREAVKYAINRDELIEKIYRGYGVVGNDHPVPPTDPFFNLELPQRPYDPDKARWHLKKAGLDSLDISLSAADGAYAGAVDTAVLMQASAAGTGINLTVDRVPNDSYWSDVWMKKPYTMSAWGVRPTPGMMFSVAFAENAPWNETFWSNDRFNELLVAGKTQTDFEKRKEIYWEMQEIVHRDGGNALFAFPAELDSYAQNVQGATTDAVARLMGCRVSERVWFA